MKQTSSRILIWFFFLCMKTSKEVYNNSLEDFWFTCSICELWTSILYRMPITEAQWFETESRLNQIKLSIVYNMKQINLWDSFFFWSIFKSYRLRSWTINTKPEYIYSSPWPRIPGPPYETNSKSKSWTRSHYRYCFSFFFIF